MLIFAQTFYNMKIYLISLLVSLLPFSLFSQIYGSGSVTETVRSFEGLKSLEITGHFVVELVQGDKDEVRIITDDNIHQYVKTEVADGELKIFMEDKWYRKIRSRKLIVTVKDLESITNKGSGDIRSTGRFSTGKLTVNLIGSGDMDLNPSVTELIVNLNGSGDISLLGNTMKLDLYQFGSGDIKAYNVQANDVTLKATGSGNIKVFANVSLSGSTSGNGDVFYKGGATSTISASGSGEVIKEY